MSFLHKVVVHEGNLMNLNNVAMIMAPNLFLVSGGRKHKANKEVEIRMAAGTANIVRMLITYKHLLPVVSWGWYRAMYCVTLIPEQNSWLFADSISNER